VDLEELGFSPRKYNTRLIEMITVTHSLVAVATVLGPTVNEAAECIVKPLLKTDVFCCEKSHELNSSGNMVEKTRKIRIRNFNKIEL
jgi:hypothetical protein